MSPDALGDMVFIIHADWDQCEQARKRGEIRFPQGKMEGGEDRERRMKEKGV